MKRILLAIAFVGIIVATGGFARQPASLTFHDLSSMARFPLGRMQTRGAMGETMSLMITELPPGLKTTPHHHHQEQMMLGLAGGMHYLMGDTPYPLPRLTAAIALPNVRHGNINETAEQATCVEFQPVLRPDWFPPHPRRPREGLPEPLPVPKERKVTESFDPSSSGWKHGATGVRSKALTGDTMRLTVMEFAPGGGSVSLAAGVEQFVFVIDGQVAIADKASQRAIGREMLVIVSPAARSTRLASVKVASGLVAVYEPIAR